MFNFILFFWLVFVFKKEKKGILGQDIKESGRETYVKEVSRESEAVTPVAFVMALLLCPSDPQTHVGVMGTHRPCQAEDYNASETVSICQKPPGLEGGC